MTDRGKLRECDELSAITPEARSSHQRGTLVERRIMLHITMIAIGAAIGANLRYAVSLWAASLFGTAFPYGTLMINLIGSFLIGILMALSITRLPLSEPVRLFVVTGLLGGFTTFSSFSYEAYALAVSGNWLLALLYLFGSMLLGFLSVVLAFGLVNLLG
jgi:fluoride exporter